MATPEAQADQLIFPPNLQHNSSLTTVKFLAACFSGAVAGILGLTNWLGFALFFAATLFTSACIYFVNCKRTPHKYIRGGFSELVNPGQDNMFSFILSWTLFFGHHSCVRLNKILTFADSVYLPTNGEKEDALSIN